MTRSPRTWLASFSQLGITLGLLGSSFIAWQYHIDVDPELIGLHFLVLNAGYVAAAALALRMLRNFAPRTIAAVASVVTALALLGLSFAFPPAAFAWRLVLLTILGASGGMLTTTLLQALGRYFSLTPALALNGAGFSMGCGCLLATLTNAVCYVTGTQQFATAVLALVPAALFILLLRDRSQLGRLSKFPPGRDRVRETLRDLRSVGAILLSLLLFFQFGNEWAIAGWLPLFITHRLGGNPVSAIAMLAVYFLALTLGRVAAKYALPAVQHWKLLLACTALAMCGYLLLNMTEKMLGAWLAVAMVGIGFAPIYPLVAERLDERFFYHPGFYNGTASIAITGAMCTPWLLGFVDARFGMRYVMLLPAVGSALVLVLALLILLEAHVMGAAAHPTEQSVAAKRF
jgi:fucose permease